MTVLEVRPMLALAVRGLCPRPYPGHPKGCPNYGRRATCPPAAPLFPEVFDLAAPVYAIVNEFDLAGHVGRMRQRHPDWSERQLYCCLYWQPKARGELAAKIGLFRRIEANCEVTTCPEAMGVDVTATLAAVGIHLEWPPRRVARQVALAAKLRNALVYYEEADIDGGSR